MLFNCSNLLKKLRDRYHALLAYSEVPLRNAYSSNQLLMGSCLHTALPILPGRLQPTLPNLQSLQHKERAQR